MRWLVLGASGWFGRTILSMAPPSTEVLAVSGASRSFVTWSEPKVEDFAPTHVFNCAFLTKEKLHLVGPAEYWRLNRMLIQRFEHAANLSSCTSVLSVSSGSVLADPEHPYSQLKRIEEDVCFDAVTESRGAVVLRAYSVTGPFVQRVNDYAFSNLLAQGLNGSRPIQVLSAGQVWRRYVDVEESIEVSLRLLRPREARVIETGGQLVELRFLARLIADELGADVDLRPPSVSSSSTYASDGTSWEEACRETEFSASDLRKQIRKTLRGCRLRGL